MGHRRSGGRRFSWNPRVCLRLAVAARTGAPGRAGGRHVRQRHSDGRRSARCGEPDRRHPLDLR